MFRHLVLLMLALAVAPALATDVTVYKSATCGCCKNWIAHLKANGFNVTARDVSDIMPYKDRHHVPPALASCYTASVDGYTIEGHIPAADILRLLQERPNVRGLAVPGMPNGSPGMEGGPAEHYQTISFDRNGHTAVFARH